MLSAWYFQLTGEYFRFELPWACGIYHTPHARRHDKPNLLKRCPWVRKGDLPPFEGEHRRRYLDAIAAYSDLYRPRAPRPSELHRPAPEIPHLAPRTQRRGRLFLLKLPDDGDDANHDLRVCVLDALMERPDVQKLAISSPGVKAFAMFLVYFASKLSRFNVVGIIADATFPHAARPDHVKAAAARAAAPRCTPIMLRETRNNAVWKEFTEHHIPLASDPRHSLVVFKDPELLM